MTDKQLVEQLEPVIFREARFVATSFVEVLDPYIDQLTTHWQILYADNTVAHRGFHNETYLFSARRNRLNGRCN